MLKLLLFACGLLFPCPIHSASGGFVLHALANLEVKMISEKRNLRTAQLNEIETLLTAYNINDTSKRKELLSKRVSAVAVAPRVTTITTTTRRTQSNNRPPVEMVNKTAINILKKTWSNATIDYSQYRTNLTHILDHMDHVDEDKDLCLQYVPQESLMLTYFNKHATSLFELQQRALIGDDADESRCLAKRFVAVALDRDSHLACLNMQARNCVFLPLPFADFPVGDFGNAAYSFLTYFKHHLMHEALKVVKQIFFVDVDVLVFSR